MKFGQGHYDTKSRKYHFYKASLPTTKDNSSVELGLPQWSCPEWRGLFYPQETTSTNFLSHYAKNLNCVELSSTFYSEVSQTQVYQWQQSVHDNFHFLPKWPKWITHGKGLVRCQNDIKTFLNNLEPFRENLGTSILQLPPTFSTEFKRELFYFLEQIPSTFPISLEFRHSSWFEDQRVYPKLEKYLMDNNRGMVCCDTPAFPSLCHFSFTSNYHVVRYVSDQVNTTDKERLGQWSSWLAKKKFQGKLYFILHREENDLTPQLISYFNPDLAEDIAQKVRGPQTNLFDG